jgi:hypothetical protein
MICKYVHCTTQILTIFNSEYEVAELRIYWPLFSLFETHLNQHFDNFFKMLAMLETPMRTAKGMMRKNGAVGNPQLSQQA